MSTLYLSDLDLLRLHVDALFAHDAEGRIYRTNEPGGRRAPRFYLGRCCKGNIWRFRDDLAEDIVEALATLASSEPVVDDLRSEPSALAAFQRVLGNDPEIRPYSGPADRFPDELPHAPGATRITAENVWLVEAMGTDWRGFGRELEEREPCWAVLEEGRATSVCFSARLTERAAEAGVETGALYKGRGHAGQVVAAWARSVHDSGRIPLYSTSSENHASQAVARKLGLIQYGTDLSM